MDGTNRIEERDRERREEGVQRLVCEDVKFVSQFQLDCLSNFLLLVENLSQVPIPLFSQQF